MGLKVSIAYLFMFFLVASTVAPTAIYFADLDCEVAVFIDAEEEEKEGVESIKDSEVKLFQELQSQFAIVDEPSIDAMSFYFKSYSFTYNELSSPPPEVALA